MDIITKIPVPKEIYQFYASAASHIQDRTAEEVMADALSAYVQLLRREPKELNE